MLYDPERHEALRAIAWDASAARRAIDAIVADTVRAFDARNDWPPHPLDLEPGETPDTVTTPLYHGACGVLWVLDHLAARGIAVPRVACDLDTLRRRQRDWSQRFASGEEASYLLGRTAIELLAFAAAPDDAIVADLERLIAGNVDNPTREFLWGSPGTMLAALFLFERTADERWAALFRHAAKTLWDALRWSDTHGCWYWTQDLYGRRSSYLGAGHGFVGNVLPLIRGRDLLPEGAWPAWEARIVETVSRTALREDGLANWDTELESAQPPKKFVQWCHGAPGIVVALGALPTTALDALLLEAGETTWAAGPLTKGAGLCHGTGGNGYAFLKLYRRTGDARWLERARAFAMHGIAQVDAARSTYGRGRHSLWTGDPGFAIYLADCVAARDAFPTLDVFWNDARADDSVVR